MSGCATQKAVKEPLSIQPPAFPAVSQVSPQKTEKEGEKALPRVEVGDAQQQRREIERLLPVKGLERRGWADDILQSLLTLRIPVTRENICAVVAVIEQESSWQAEPTVPNLPAIVWKKIAERAQQYFVPLPLVKTVLLKPSQDGRSYKQRIDTLRTERQMNDLFEEMVVDARHQGFPVSMKNPIRTGGPMQVSIDFAEKHVKIWSYPWPMRGTVRQEVFTRRGGIYFGTAILLQYPAVYSKMIYRFADFNAGRYSSRNAAFQAAVAKLAGIRLALDGDLLNYQAGQSVHGATVTALKALAPRLAMRLEDIHRDLGLEKQVGFAETQLFRQVFNLADRLGPAMPREIIPTIVLKSPKITRKLTTEWFAKRVDQRYQACLAKG